MEYTAAEKWEYAYDTDYKDEKNSSVYTFFVKAT